MLDDDIREQQIDRLRQSWLAYHAAIEHVAIGAIRKALSFSEAERKELVNHAMQSRGITTMMSKAIWDAAKERITEALQELYRKVFRRIIKNGTGEWQRAAEQGEELLLADLYEEFIQDRANYLSGIIIGTTADDVTKKIAMVLKTSIEQDLTEHEMAQALNNALGQLLGDSADETLRRAQTIVRTETTSIINTAEMEYNKKEGATKEKRWLSAQDQLVRDSHRHAEAQGWIDINAEFSNGLQHPGDSAGGPEEIINCRCVAIFR